MSYKKLGELLVANNVITNLQLSIALAAQESSPRRLGEILIERGFTTETAIAGCLAQQYGYPVFDVGQVTPQPNALVQLKPDFALEHGVLPLTIDDHEFECVLCDPVNIVATDEIALATKRRLKIWVGAVDPVMKEIRRAYGLDENATENPVEFAVPSRFVSLRPRRGFGAVSLFDAVDHELDRRVTLATLPSGSPEERSLRRRVQAAARTPHKSVAAIHDWFEFENRSWVVLERLEGETLAHILRTRGERNCAQAADLVAKIADGLEALNTAGGYTGLVSPHNILIQADGPLLLPLDSPDQALYGAPEGDVGAPQTALWDIYALATVLWESLRAANPHQVVRQKAGTTLGWAEINPHEVGMPPAMVEILTRAASKAPENRTPSAAVFAKALRAFNWSAVASPKPAESTVINMADRDQLLSSLDTSAPSSSQKSGFWGRLFGRAA